MRIIIATGIYPPDIGGPAQYAKEVADAWRRNGHSVVVCNFSALKFLPTVVRHLVYFLWILVCSLRVYPVRSREGSQRFSASNGADFIFIPDTFSAAVPAVVVGKILRKKTIIRTGGDFLWEQYVERTGDLILLRNFYTTRLEKLNAKEQLVFYLVGWALRNASAVVFSTPWHKDIFSQPYRLDLKRCFVVENYYGPKERSATPMSRMHPNIPNKKEGIVEKELSYMLGGVFFEIHNELGRFCRERQYSDMLEKRLEEKNIHFVRELPIEIAGRKSNFADFVVSNKVLIEVKAKDFIGKEEYFQVMRYLEATDLELGLIVNFRNKYLKPQRVLNPKYSKHINNSGAPFGKVFGYHNSGVPFGKAFGYKMFVGGVRPLKWKNLARVKNAFAEARKKDTSLVLQLETGSRGKFLLDIEASYAVIIASLGDVSPNTILEAIQFGKPFILTRETGLYEKLKDIGVWVDPEDVSDIAAKIEWLCDERNYDAQVKKVRRFTFAHSYEEIAKEILDIHHRVVV